MDGRKDLGIGIGIGIGMNMLPLLFIFLGADMKMILAVACAWRCVLILAQIVEENKNKLTGWFAEQNARTIILLCSMSVIFTSVEYIITFNYHIQIVRLIIIEFDL